jgi:Ca2+-binding EF-hand superfamily protein
MENLSKNQINVLNNSLSFHVSSNNTKNNRATMINHTNITTSNYNSVTNNNNNNNNNNSNDSFVNNISKRNRVVNEALREHVTKEMLLEVQDTFDILADPQTGLMPITKLALALKAFDLTPDLVDSVRIPAEFDVDKFLEIIIVGTKNPLWCANEMSEVFRIFDKNESGYLERDEIRTIFSRLNETYNETEIADQLREFDLDGDGRIVFAEFANMVLITKGKDYLFEDNTDF